MLETFDGSFNSFPISTILVPGRELESPHLAIHGPEPCASTNSATRASLAVYHYWYIAMVQAAEIFNRHTLRQAAMQNLIYKL